MRSDPPIILVLQILPIVVLILALTEPSSAIPIFIFLAILFPILLFKFFQQAFNDFEREIYSRNQPKTQFKDVYEIPINLEGEPKVQAFNPLQPYLYLLRLQFPYTLEQLNHAYRQRARETHPDVRGGSTRDFLRVREAYEVLKKALELKPTDE
jgi:DnaJ domain